MRKSSEYRAHAQECLALAKRMKASTQADALRQMAVDWEEMAVYRAKLIALHPELAKEGELQEEAAPPTRATL